MKVAILQYPIVWADKEANLLAWEDRLRALKGEADVALLPEMCTTGFCTDRPDLAEPADGPTIRRMQAMAEETDMMICGSFICAESGRLYNRGFMLRPGMAPVFVDKRHLYYAEKQYFSAGDQRPIVEWRGAKFRYIICYDLRFPVWSRNAAAPPYDIQIYVANWPASRRIAWDTLLRARAIENQCYVAAVNRVGDDPSCHYDGGTCLIDARGNTIASATDNSEAVITAHIDIESLRRFRTKFPVLNDAD